MEIPFKSVWQLWTRTPAPIIISVLVCLYIASLSYYKYIFKPKPEFDFYNKSIVYVVFPENALNYAITGTFNNVIEGQRKSVQAQKDSIGRYVLTFDVNSPRPAKLFIEGEEVSIFLTKDSTLTVNVWLDPELGLLDSLQFKGLASSICQYYQDKMKAFPESGARTAAHTLSSEETQTYHQKLDSLSLQETLFLTTKKLQYNLPEWFVKFESSEISYQKAYLKITNQRDRAEIKMDTLKIDNPDAVFSYYYYLYLNAYFQQLVAKKDEKTAELQQLALADSLLKSETRDVYFSRSLFAHLQRKEITEASEIFEKFPKFTQQKYFRFLNWEITRSKKALESSSTY